MTDQAIAGQLKALADDASQVAAAKHWLAQLLTLKASGVRDMMGRLIPRK